MIRPSSMRAASAASAGLLRSTSTISAPAFVCSSARLASTQATSRASSSRAPLPPAAQPVSTSTRTSQAQNPAQSEAALPKVIQLKYGVERTSAGNLAVYDEARSGGTRKETIIKHIVGSQQDMKLDIINDFKFKKEDVNVNPVTGHVRIKGHHTPKIVAWLTERGF